MILLEPNTLFWDLIRDGENTAIKILKSLNVDLYELRKEIELAVKDKTGKNIANINSLPLTKQAEKVIRITVLEAKANKSPLVESEHLMLSILRTIKKILPHRSFNQFDVDYDMFKNELGYVKTDPKAEFQDDEGEEFDEEKKHIRSSVLQKEPPMRQNPKPRCSIILEGILPGLQK